MSELVIRPDLDGNWQVAEAGNSQPLILGLSRQDATDFATNRLAQEGGGQVKTFNRVGLEVSSAIVNADGGLELADSSRPRRAVRPKKPAAKSENETIEKASEALAKAIDRDLGRTDPESPLGDFAKVKPTDFMPQSLRNHHAVTTVSTGVGAGSFGLAVIAFLLGTGTLSAVVAKAASFKGTPTLGSYLQFGDAFWVTLPLSMATAAFTVLAMSGSFKSFTQAAFTFVALALVSVGFSSFIGKNTPTMQDILYAAGSQNPGAQASSVMTVFLEYYTLVPFLGGLLTGGLTGWIIHTIWPPETANS